MNIYTGDIQFVKTHLPTLRKEYDFWMTERVITVDGHSLNIYNSAVNQPRPESYREDKMIADTLATGRKAENACLCIQNFHFKFSP